MAYRRLIVIFFPLLLQADSFEDYKAKQEKAFKNKKLKFIDFKKQEDAAFNTYLKKEKDAIKAYEKQVSALWPQNDLQDAKKLTNYSKDLQTKTMIDFEKNQIVISTKHKVSKNDLLKKLDETLSLTSEKAYAQNNLEQKIKALSAPSKYIKTSALNPQPLLLKKVDHLRSEKAYITQDGGGKKLTYSLPKDATYKRSFNYLRAAKSNAIRFNVSAEILLAIMHSESSFNPMARSHIPAFGLMQIVPKSAGIDSYKFLYKKRRLLSASYLYNTTNNIEIGSAYFHILYYKYLASIKNPQSRLYCAIAGYNTGAGNVAWAFVHNNNVKKASKRINKMSPQEVYNHLLKNLKYDEPKHYLKRVRQRSIRYKRLYRL